MNVFNLAIYKNYNRQKIKFYSPCRVMCFEDYIFCEEVENASVNSHEWL